MAFIAKRDRNMEKTYRSKYLEGFLLSVEDAWTNRRYTDVTINLGNKSYPSHRIILESQSTYFKEIFATTTENNVNISNVDGETFEIVLRYIYTGNLDQVKNTLERVITAATALQMPCLQQVCAELLVAKLTLESSIRIHKLATKLNCDQLSKQSRYFILEHFERIVDQDAFGTLSEEELLSIIDNDDLNVTSEDKVINSVLVWVSKNPADRSIPLGKLLGVVRFQLISNDFLKSLRENPTVPKTALELIDQFCTNSATAPNELKQIRYRTEEIICVVGTRSRHPNPESTDIKCFSFKTHATYQLAALPEEPGACCAVCKGDNDVFLSGGYLGQKKLLRYVSAENKWQECADMTEGRWGHSMTYVNDFVYILGGSRKVPEPISSVEIYDINSNKTSLIGALQIPVSFAAVASLEHNIYIFGGKLATHGVCNEIQCYNTKENTCKVVGKLPEVKTSVARTAVLDNTIFIFYGHGKVVVFKEGQATEVVTTGNKFDHFGVVPHGGRIIIDGSYGNQYSTVVFDPVTKEMEPYHRTLKVALCNFYCMPVVMKRNILQACA